MSCSLHSSAIVFGPRSDASTISVFCWAVNFRYLRVSLKTYSLVLERPCSTLSRTGPESRCAARLPLKSDQAGVNAPPGPRQASTPAPTRAAKPATKTRSAQKPARTRSVAPRGQTRATVLEALKDGPKTAGEISQATGIPRASASTTLNKLAKTGDVIKAERGYRLPA